VQGKFNERSQSVDNLADREFIDKPSVHDRSSVTSMYRDTAHNSRAKQHMIDTLSIKTPYSNIGEVQSKYAGTNTALRNWYNYKQTNLGRVLRGSTTMGDYPEIYSQFSKGSISKLKPAA
jgi:hypothetical protein